MAPGHRDYRVHRVRRVRRTGGLEAGRRHLVVGVVAWLAFAALLRLGVAQPERCGNVDVEAWQRSAAAAVDWFAANQDQDGRWLYRYRLGVDPLGNDYNLVRHAGAALALAQAAGSGFPAAGPLAVAGLGYVAAHLSEPGPGQVAFGDPGTTLDVGATALTVAAALELWPRRHATPGRGQSGPSPTPVAASEVGFDDTVLAGLGRFLVAQLGPDGSVASYRNPDGSVVDERSRFYTGEVTWALVRLHGAFPGGGWHEPAQRALDYLVNRRDTREGWFPPIADHWAAYALAEAQPLGLLGGPVGEGTRRFVVRQAQRFGPQVREEAQRTSSWFTTFTRARVPVAAALGTVGEGLGGLRRLAEEDPVVAHSLPTETLDERLGCVAELLVRRQTGPGAAARADRPERVTGAWFTAGVTQMDDQQHALSALLAAIASRRPLAP